ncbi:hypothetical protein V2J09_009521 [Rumex salicifolius]
MALSGLVGCPSGYSVNLSARKVKSLDGRVHAFSSVRTRDLFMHNGSYLVRYGRESSLKKRGSIQCAMDTPYGDSMSDSSAIFPRINVRDPYKRLGLNKDASEEEILSARNFLIQRYAGHKPSVDAIESAHDKIIMQKFYERKNPKINIKKKVRDVTQSRYVQAVLNRFKTPSTKFIAVTAAAFLVLGMLTVLYPTEEGPTLQVAISVISTMCFIHHRLKSKIRAILYGIGAFVFSWFFGTFLMATVVPPILKGPRSLEVTTSLISYVLLWVSSTYLK